MWKIWSANTSEMNKEKKSFRKDKSDESIDKDKL